jgi:hypothetical protein
MIERVQSAFHSSRVASRLELQKREAVYAPKHPALSTAQIGKGASLPEALHQRMEPLVRALLKANPFDAETTPLSTFKRLLPGQASWPEDAGTPQWTVLGLSLSDDHESYPYLSAAVRAEGLNGVKRDIDVQFRSNGRAAFIDRSYVALQQSGLQKFHFAYAGEGFVGTDDQALFLLRNLGPDVTLSRVMSPQEAEIWKTGEPWRLTSSFVPRGTHFGLNSFRYKKTTPYQLKVPRGLLERLYASGQLVVNTYEDSRVSPRGINPEGRGPFGLEFELVALGEGRRRLKPYFARALEEGARPTTT